MDRKYESGNLIYLLRTEKGYTQNDIAKMMGVTNKAVSKWETGAAVPRMDHLIRLAEILGCTQEELYLGKRKTEASPDADPDKPDVTDDYLTIVRRCDCCKHEVTSISALLGLRPLNYFAAPLGILPFSASFLIPDRRKHKKTTVCSRCGASVSLTRKGEVVLFVMLLALLVLTFSLYSNTLSAVFSHDILTPHHFATPEDAQEYRAMLETIDKFFGTGTLILERVCTELVLFGLAICLYLLLRRFIKRRILKHFEYRIISYPHAEDGKIVL